MEPASLNAGDVMETRTVRMEVMRKTVRAPKGCVTLRPSLPAKIQVIHGFSEVKSKQKWKHTDKPLCWVVIDLL